MGIESSFIDYFRNVFATSSPQGMEGVLETLAPSVTSSMNAFLLKEVTPVEVKRAVFQLGAWKAPRPDGFPALFYQTHRNIVGEKVTQAVTHFFNISVMDPRINFTHIVLIPKIANPRKVLDFLPISLWNVLYKVVSRVLIDRLKAIMPLIISECQSAFIKGRLITNNILLAYEASHSMKHSQAMKGSMAIKLDMSKAYDHLEWPFIRAVMAKIGFESRWIELIMSCVTMASYSILINGEAKGAITPTRGVRQGDPLSPYLFILCVEAFSNLLMREKVL